LDRIPPAAAVRVDHAAFAGAGAIVVVALAAQRAALIAPYRAERAVWFDPGPACAASQFRAGLAPLGVSPGLHWAIAR
jgi:hypothetical protein